MMTNVAPAIHVEDRVTPTELRLKYWREKRKMTQQDLALEAGVQQSLVSRLETGVTRVVDLDVIDKLAIALRCKPGDLLVRE